MEALCKDAELQAFEDSRDGWLVRHTSYAIRDSLVIEPITDEEPDPSVPFEFRTQLDGNRVARVQANPALHEILELLDQLDSPDLDPRERASFERKLLEIEVPKLTKRQRLAGAATWLLNPPWWVSRPDAVKVYMWIIQRLALRIPRGKSSKPPPEIP